MKAKPPCKECADRFVCCHSECEGYKAFLKKYAEQKEAHAESIRIDCALNKFNKEKGHRIYTSGVHKHRTTRR